MGHKILNFNIVQNHRSLRIPTDKLSTSGLTINDEYDEFDSPNEIKKQRHGVFGGGRDAIGRKIPK